MDKNFKNNNLNGFHNNFNNNSINPLISNALPNCSIDKIQDESEEMDRNDHDLYEDVNNDLDGII